MKTRSFVSSVVALLRKAQALAIPILLAVSPILYLFQHNQADLPLNVIWIPVLISAVAAASLFALCSFIFKPALKAALAASLLVVGIFYYGIVYDVAVSWGLSNGVVLALWVVLLVLASATLYKLKDPNILGQAVLVVTIASILISVLQIGLFRVQNPPVSVSDPRLWSAAFEKPAFTGTETLPDIYYIVPDDYARTDVLKEHFGYDNSAFIHELEKRGFVIVGQSRSPYSDSESNMASALNLDYLNHFADVLGADSDNSLMVTQVLEDNRASRFLEGLGYQYIHIDSDNTTFPGNNPGISPIAAPDNLNYLWLRASILRPFDGEFGFSDNASDERFRRSVRDAFLRLNATPELPGPKFVFFHTLIPHDPYVFGPEGESVTFPNPSDERIGSPEGIKFYVQQLRFSSALLLASIDEIQAHSKTPPIIILQADEGFQSNTEAFSEEIMKDIRIKGLSAFSIPGKDVSGLPENLNNVNTFRYLFDLLFNTRLGMLENASYAEGDLPFQPVELYVIGDPETVSP